MLTQTLEEEAVEREKFGMSRTEVYNFMSESTNENDWNDRCDIVKARCNRDYPPFWYHTIILSGLLNRVASTWRSER